MNDATDIWSRRDLLETCQNPHTRLDYLVSLDGSISFGHRDLTDDRVYTVSVTLRYVPDKRILAPPAFTAYLGHLSDGQWGALEELTAVLLEDVNNEVVPRWGQVVVTARPGGLNYGHVVSMEDRQPGWKNPALMDRLIRI